MIRQLIFGAAVLLGATSMHAETIAWWLPNWDEKPARAWPIMKLPIPAKRSKSLSPVLTNTDNSKTLPIGLSEFATMFTVDWGSTMAAAFLMTVPVVAVFLLFQKQFVSGLSAGAVKG